MEETALEVSLETFLCSEASVDDVTHMCCPLPLFITGNSLLECVVFGRIAGERAATVKHSDNVMFPAAASDDGHSESKWVPVVLREVRNTDKKYGMNTREIRFNMHGSFQHSVSISKRSSSGETCVHLNLTQTVHHQTYTGYVSRTIHCPSRPT